MLYHYTDIENLESIQRCGEIRPHKIKVTKDLFPTERSEYKTIGPILWLTTNPVLEGTAIIKLCHGKLERLRRIVLPPDYCDVGLGDYCDLHGIDYDWLTPMIQSGSLVGSHYSTWRLHARPIPSSDWVAVQSHPWPEQ